MSTNKTENYQLSQWVKSDQVLMEDFNADNAKIDAALKAEADTRAAETSALTAALAGKGNCQLWTTSYYGTGGVGPANARSLSFPKRPVIAFVLGGGGFMPLMPGAPGTTTVCDSNSMSVTTSWSGNTVSWYGGSAGWVMMNASGTTYQVVAFLPA